MILETQILFGMCVYVPVGCAMLGVVGSGCVGRVCLLSWRTFVYGACIDASVPCVCVPALAQVSLKQPCPLRSARPCRADSVTLTCGTHARAAPGFAGGCLQRRRGHRGAELEAAPNDAEEEELWSPCLSVAHCLELEAAINDAEEEELWSLTLAAQLKHLQVRAYAQAWCIYVCVSASNTVLLFAGTHSSSCTEQGPMGRHLCCAKACGAPPLRGC
eukprot:210265-Pelagomonas_calceolata.AAC.17